jgi:hypothetical protein
MPKVSMPLFSFGATGSISKLLTFRNSPRGYICRKYAVPTGEASAVQEEVREFTGERMMHWALLSVEEQASWLLLALERNVEPINAYLQENWKRKIRGLGTTDCWPVIELPLYPAMIVSGGDPFPEPDCTGTYEYEGEIGEDHYYKRMPEDDYFLFYDWTQFIWIISLSNEMGSGANDWWGINGKDGDYVPDPGYTGYLVVSES